MRELFIRLRDGFYRSPPLLLLCTAACWGANTVFGQLAKDEIGPMTVVMLRWLIVAAIMWPLYGREVRAAWPELRPFLPRLALLAAIGFTTFNALMYVAAYGTTAVNIGIIQGAGPIIVLVGAYFFLGEKPGAIQLVGVALTIVGLVIVTSKGAPAELLRATLAWGDPVMLLAVVFYGIYTLGIAKRPAVSGRVFFTFVAVIAAVFGVPLGVTELAILGEPAPTLEGWLVVIGIAVFPSLLGQLFFLRGVDLIGPSRAIVYINFVPIFGAALAVAILGESFRGYHGLALLLVTIGVFAAQRAPARAAASSPAAEDAPKAR